MSRNIQGGDLIPVVLYDATGKVIGGANASLAAQVSPASNYLQTVGAHARDNTISAATVLTKPNGANHILLQALTQNIRYRLDGTNPTTAVGFQLAAGEFILLHVPGADVRVIEETATGEVQYQWME